MLRFLHSDKRSRKTYVPDPPLDEPPLDAPPPYAPLPASPGLVIPYDNYKNLAKFNTVLVIDDSYSMRGQNWKETQEALEVFVPICTKYDSDGIDIYFLNNRDSWKCITSSAKVLEIFSKVEPDNGTPTGGRLGEIFTEYLESYEKNRNIKPMNIIVITDGSPTDPYILEQNIIKTAKKLDQLQAPCRQLGVQFFQVGNNEAATRSLVRLDNFAQANDMRDMIDTVSWEKMNGGKGLNLQDMLKVVMGAIDIYLDSVDIRGWCNGYAVTA